MRVLLLLVLLVGCGLPEPASTPLDEGIHTAVLTDVYFGYQDAPLPELTADDWNYARKSARLALVDDSEYWEFCKGNPAVHHCCFTVINNDPFVIVHEDEDQTAHVIHETVQHMSVWAATRNKPKRYVIDVNEGHRFDHLNQLEQDLYEMYLTPNM